MCGIFGIIGQNIQKKDFLVLSRHARQRGKDSSGLVLLDKKKLVIVKKDSDISFLNRYVPNKSLNLVLGHSRLITNGLNDNQPIIKEEVIVIHNGIVVNDEEIWKVINVDRNLTTDSEIIAALAMDHLNKNLPLSDLPERIFSLCIGIVSAALFFPKLGKLLLISNNGSLYVGKLNQQIFFSSEKYPLVNINCQKIEQILKYGMIIDTVCFHDKIELIQENKRTTNIIPQLINNVSNEKLLEYNIPSLQRCSKCILPETMPFITFNTQGVCNFCLNYSPRNRPRDKDELNNILEAYRGSPKSNCIFPFSGGRDSSFGLHLLVKEFSMKPITYTYDWGMVTDLARRNISRMSSALKVENIIIAANIEKKRKYISLNLKAWLKHPNLGMLSILTSGDKHFFRHIETVKKQTGINLNLWSINPLEVTHFKSGFLGIPPDFFESKVYSQGWKKQFRYQKNRFKEMSKSPQYFNQSLWDTLSGEYYRSSKNKTDYFHLFDYWKWDEFEINRTLAEYSWETATDTSSTWRIGDGTAAFYNYVYYTVAGFTEHDTFRSNQIREGQLSRERALQLVLDENRPRYQNLKWYLDVLNFDFESTIKRVNLIPKLY